MTQRQTKLIENYVRQKVKKMLNENTEYEFYQKSILPKIKEIHSQISTASPKNIDNIRQSLTSDLFDLKDTLEYYFKSGIKKN